MLLGSCNSTPKYQELLWIAMLRHIRQGEVGGLGVQSQPGLHSEVLPQNKQTNPQNLTSVMFLVQQLVTYLTTYWHKKWNSGNFSFLWDCYRTVFIIPDTLIIAGIPENTQTQDVTPQNWENIHIKSLCSQKTSYSDM
jgi:hypothetical protein